MANKKNEWKKRIKALRVANDWTQDVLADLLGLKTRGAVSLLESGNREPTGPVRRLIIALENNPNILSKLC